MNVSSHFESIVRLGALIEVTVQLRQTDTGVDWRKEDWLQSLGTVFTFCDNHVLGVSY